MKQILIASFDLEVGGVERSLISMLNNFNYDDHLVDVFLHSHSGEFMCLLPEQANLQEEIPAYKTFRLPIRDIFTSRHLMVGFARLLARARTVSDDSLEPGYKQMQWMWKYALPFLPRLSKEYDVAISYLWPHHFVAEKVNATTKIAWIHTDFSTVSVDVESDYLVWNKFNYIAAVSEACRLAFTTKFPKLAHKTIVIENITSPLMIRELAEEDTEHEMMKDTRFKIITVARLSHAKGIDRAIKALSILKERGFTDIVWYVVGYGGDEEMLRRLITEHHLQDQFILVGKKINPYPFMKAADLYVQPSRYEGKAVTVVEAQILLKPVLITNYQTAKSQVNHEIDGMICEQSIEGIANGIEEIYNNPSISDQLIAHCRETDFHNSNELVKLYQCL